MKPKRSNNFIIKGTVYPFDVMVSVNQSDEDVQAALESNGIDVTDANIGTYSATQRGRCVMFGGGQVLLRVFQEIRTPLDYGYLQHELFHAVYFIMDRIGITLCHKSDEAFAYLIGYLTKEIYERL